MAWSETIQRECCLVQEDFKGIKTQLGVHFV